MIEGSGEISQTPQVSSAETSVPSAPAENSTAEIHAPTSASSGEAPKSRGGWVDSFRRVLNFGQSVAKQAGEPQKLNPMSQEPPKPIEGTQPSVPQPTKP